MQHESILAQYKDAVDKSSIFSKTDVNGNIIYVNDKFCEITGYSEAELLGKTHAIIKDPSTPKTLFKELWKTIASGQVWNGLLKNRKKDGSHYYVNSSIYPIKDEDGNLLEYISIRQDITELISSQELLDIYSKDTLTNLPNRQKLNEKLKDNSTEMMGILLDIKDFSMLNELYGKDVCDELLLKISLQLKTYLNNDGVTLYRLCSDHYFILIEDSSLFNKYKSLIEFTFLSEDNFIINDIVISFSISMVIASNEILSKASLALKQAKQRKSRFFVYDDSINTKDIYKDNLKRFEDFKEALLNDRIEPFFQPIVDAKTEKIIKYESLARIIDKDGNVIAVSDFLPIAEKSSFFENFTRQMIQKIFVISNLSNKEVTINLTYENINSKTLVKYIENRLQMHKGPRITFEILESEEITDYSVLEDFVSMVKKYGSFIAIDDFGTGYSNFVHLTKFKADFIKIDGSIISNLEDDNNKLVLSILIEYAKKSNIKTIAEYVSSPQIAKIAKELGVDLLQGYHYGKAEQAKYYDLV